jgi:site-specific DNA recombinase
MMRSESWTHARARWGTRVRTSSCRWESAGCETVVRADDGSPVVRSEPILIREVFDRLGVELADRENRKEPTKCSSGATAPDRSLWRLWSTGVPPQGGTGRKPRYRCTWAQYKEPCGNESIPLEYANDVVEGPSCAYLEHRNVLSEFGIQARTNSAELAEVNEMLTDLTGLLGTGPTVPGLRSVQH